MLEPVSTWNAVAPHVSTGLRVLVATVGAVALAAITKALTTHADRKPPPGAPSAGKQPQPLERQQPEAQAQDQAAELLRRAELAATASTAAAIVTDRAAEAPSSGAPSDTEVEPVHAGATAIATLGMMSRAAMECAAEYSSDRMQFGHPSTKALGV